MWPLLHQIISPPRDACSLQVMYAEGDKTVSLGESLVKAGYARLVNWGLEMMSLGAHSLREAERNAKQQRIAMWRNP